ISERWPNAKPKTRQILHRLATYERMRTDVWQRLPNAAVGFEGRVIDWTVDGLSWAAAFRPPYPTTKAGIAEHVSKYPPPPSLVSAAFYGRQLIEEMDGILRDSDADWGYWHSLLLQARTHVEFLARFFELLSHERQAIAAQREVPAIKKQRAKNSSEIL